MIESRRKHFLLSYRF